MNKYIVAVIVAASLITSTALFAQESMKEYILTPPSSTSPRINGAKIFGVRPGSPFFFLVPVSGSRPMKITAENLPEGLTINSGSGVLSGKIDSLKKMIYHVKIQANNKFGETNRDLRIVVGDTICLTPPMGWNSWYGCSEGVSAKQVKQVADAFVTSGLREHGWSFVNIDDCWQGPRDPKTNALNGNERFPDMKEMCDYVHGHGLKVGIYSSPWIGTYAGFRGGSSDHADGTYTNCLPEEKRLQPNQIYGRYPGFKSFNAGRVGKHWFFDRDAKEMAKWGIDYIKVDWKPNDVPTATRMNNDLLNSGRDIVLSLSNAAPIKNAPGLSKVSNLWRTGGDIHDRWKSISRCFSSLTWNEFQSPGHWNDMDMLQVGMRGVPNRFNSKPKMTRLTPDEQYTQMTMWCLQSNPLLLSCYVHLLDEFTLSLLTNDEVIEINQDPLGNVAIRNSKKGDLEIWSKKLEDGSIAVGLFNRGIAAAKITVNGTDLGLKGNMKVRDLWRQKDLGNFKDSFTTSVNAHGVVLVEIK
jgi:alpha-galactosidase